MWKKFKLKFSFRFLAMIDVLTAEQFELTCWDKEGIQKSKTHFSKKEIEKAAL